MKINIPNSAWLGNIDPFLRSIDTSNPDSLNIATHTWLSVHPLVLCIIAALGISVKPKNINIDQIEAKNKHYFKTMKLFDLLKIDSGIKIEEHEPAGRFIPLTQISNSKKLKDFITEIIPLLHLEPDQADPIRYVISELTRNVFEHSESKIGAIVCAQYFKKSNRIRIGIVDKGVGIKKTIAASYNVKSSLEAIRLALTPGVTGTTKRVGGTDYNAGAGLFFIKSLAKINRDFFVIYSGNTLYKLLRIKSNEKVRLYGDPFEDKHSKDEDLPFWQGTAVGVDISLDSKEEFAGLLRLIRTIYSETIKERKKEFRKKPRFL